MSNPRRAARASTPPARPAAPGARAPAVPRAPTIPIAGSLALALAMLAYYLALAPHVAADGDSAELTLVLATGGVAHPTGYPLYTILGHGFVAALHALGVGYPYAANAWGALGGAVALFFLHRVSISVLPPMPRGTKPAAFALAPLPALLLGFDPQWVAECLKVEVYTWHVAWVCGACWLFVRLTQDLSDRSRPLPLASRMLAWGFLCGVGGAHHATSVFYAAAFTAGLIWALVRAGRFRAYVPLLWLAGGLIPMMSYAHILWRASHAGTAAIWPGLEPGVRGLYQHVSGSIYRGFLGSWRPDADVSRDLARDIAPILWPGLILLAVRLARPREAAERAVMAALLAGSALQLAFAYRYGVADPVSYFLAPLAISALGVETLTPPLASWMRGRARPLLAVAAVCVVLLAVWGTRAGLRVRQDVNHYDQVVRSMWAAVPDQPSIFLWASDSYYKVKLYQRFEGSKPMVAVYNTAMLCQDRPEREFQRRYGFDPLANNGPEHAREQIAPQFIPEHHVLLDDRYLGRVNETIADSAKVPVLMFNGSEMRLRRLN